MPKAPGNTEIKVDKSGQRTAMCYLIAEVTTKKRMEKKGFLLEVRTCRRTHSQDRVIPREHGLPFMVSFIQLFILQTFTEYASWAKTCGDTTVNKIGQVPSPAEAWQGRQTMNKSLFAVCSVWRAVFPAFLTVFVVMETNNPNIAMILGYILT